MLDTIEKLRKKPDHKKKQIAFFFSFLLAGTIFVVWLTVIYPDFIKKQSRESEVSKLEPSPTDGLANIISGATETIGGEFNRIKDLISMFSSSETYYVASSTDTVYSSSTVDTSTSTIEEGGL